MKLIFSVDATCDVPAKFIKENNLVTVGLNYIIGDEDGMWHGTESEKEIQQFFNKMKEGLVSKTSLVTYEQALDALEPTFAAGNDVFHFGLSSGLALTWENAKKAGEFLAAKYGRKFYTCDTKTASAGNYYLLKLAMKKYEQCKSAEQTVEYINNISSYITAYFTVDTFTYLVRGGRVSKAKAFMGGMLNIKPILAFSPDGKLVNVGKQAGRQKSLNYLAQTVSEINKDVSNEVFIVHANSLQDAVLLKEKVMQQDATLKVEIINLGVIIGSHTGPGTMGLGFISKQKRV